MADKTSVDGLLNAVDNFNNDLYGTLSWTALTNAIDSKPYSNSTYNFLNLSTIQNANQQNVMHVNNVTAWDTTNQNAVNISKTGLNSNSPSKVNNVPLQNVGNAKASQTSISGYTYESAGSTWAASLLQAPAAVGTGLKLGVVIDSAAYNISKEMGYDMPRYVDPTWWKNLTKGDDSLGAQLFNAVFDIDTSEETAQGYISADAFAYLSYWAMKQGWFDGDSATWNCTGSDWALIDPNGVAFNQMKLNQHLAIITERASENPPTYNSCRLTTDADIGFFVTENSNATSPVLGYPESGARTIRVVGTQAFSVTVQLNNNNPTTLHSQSSTITSPLTGLKYTMHYVNPIVTGLTRPQFSNSVGYRVNTKPNTPATINQQVFWMWIYGTQSSPRPDGISTYPGYEMPSVSGWETPADTYIHLQADHPEWFDPNDPNFEGKVITYLNDNNGSPQLNSVVYIPIPFPIPVSSTNPQDGNVYTWDSQNLDPEEPYHKSDDNSELNNQLLLAILNQISDLNPYVVEEKDPEEEEEKEEVEEESAEETVPVDTGTGSTPLKLEQVGSPTAFWSVYNPSLGTVNAVGAWLWDANIISQLRNIFDDPIQGIISVHKIFVMPNQSAARDIVIGRLVAGKVGDIGTAIQAVTVASQYKTYSCGTVLLQEQFGNVFDYEPYTSVSLYLPFIGIVPLKVADVMRASITITYNVDVFTGDFLVDVNILRDNAGGTLYQFNGNMAVRYPVSQSNYTNFLLSVAPAVASIAFGGGIAAIAGGSALAAGGGARIAASAARISGGVDMMGQGLAQGYSSLSSSNTINNTSRSGTLTSNFGAMGTKTPYLIVSRPQSAMSINDYKFNGMPSNQVDSLNRCKDFTRVRAVRLAISTATSEELTMIENELKSGVIF